MRRQCSNSILILAVLALLIVPWSALADTTVTMLDVGQGDAIWIHDDAGYDMLIDAGDDAHGEVVNQYLADSGVEDLDVVLFTHSHEDHIGGLADVLSYLPVGQMYYNGLDYDSVTFNELMDLIITFGIPLQSVHRGDTFSAGECTATVLHPDRVYANTNDDSIVIRLSCGNVNFLLAGDAEWDSEYAMLQSGMALDAEVLKVAHHGSVSSTHTEFLDAVQPMVAVISVGADNDYGHPSSVVLNRLAARGVYTYRTDQNGTIAIRTDGTTYWVDATYALQLPMVYLPFVGQRAAQSPLPTQPVSPTATRTATVTRTDSPTPTATWTPSATVTPTATRTSTSAPSATPTETRPAAPPPTATATRTQTPHPSATRTNTPSPTQTQVPAAPCQCTGDLYNCSDFDYHWQAQQCYDYCMQQAGYDVHRLDSDKDGIACESLP